MSLVSLRDSNTRREKQQKNLVQPWSCRGFHFCRRGQPSAPSRAGRSVTSAAAPETAISVAETHQRCWTQTNDIIKDVQTWRPRWTVAIGRSVDDNQVNELVPVVVGRLFYVKPVNIWASWLVTCRSVWHCSPSKGPSPAQHPGVAPAAAENQKYGEERWVWALPWVTWAGSLKPRFETLVYLRLFKN